MGNALGLSQLTIQSSKNDSGGGEKKKGKILVPAAGITIWSIQFTKNFELWNGDPIKSEETFNWKMTNAKHEVIKKAAIRYLCGKKLLSWIEAVNPLTELIVWLLDRHRLQHLHIVMNLKRQFVNFRVELGDSEWEQKLLAGDMYLPRLPLAIQLGIVPALEEGRIIAASGQLK